MNSTIIKKKKNLLNIKYNIFCISCFRKDLWVKNSYNLNSKNEEVISIENVYKENLYYDNNFLVVIHKINLNENYSFM